MARRLSYISELDEDWAMFLSHSHLRFYLYALNQCSNSGVWRPKTALFKDFHSAGRFDTKLFLEEINKDDFGNYYPRIVVSETGNWCLMSQLRTALGEKNGFQPKIGAHRGLLSDLLSAGFKPLELPEINWGKLQIADIEQFIFYGHAWPYDGYAWPTESHRISTDKNTYKYKDKDNLKEKEGYGEKEDFEVPKSANSGTVILVSDSLPKIDSVKPITRVEYTGPQECRMRVDKNFRDPMMKTVQQVYDMSWDEYRNVSMYPELSSSPESMGEWRAFVDLIIEKEWFDVFAVEKFVSVGDFSVLISEKGFTREYWEPVMEKMLASGIQPNYNLFMRIPQFLKPIQERISRHQADRWNAKKNLNSPTYLPKIDYAAQKQMLERKHPAKSNGA